jgi:hypothetical protein
MKTIMFVIYSHGFSPALNRFEWARENSHGTHAGTTMPGRVKLAGLQARLIAGMGYRETLPRNRDLDGLDIERQYLFGEGQGDIRCQYMPRGRNVGIAPDAWAAVRSVTPS